MQPEFSTTPGVAGWSNSVSFEIEERRIDVADLQLGMFVCRLDRPWEETPFLLQGVALARLEDIETLQRLCREVYIDSRRQIPLDAPKSLTRSDDLSGYRFSSNTHYTDLSAVEDEAPRARAALENASQIIDDLFEDITSGRELSVEHVEQAVRPLVTTVLRSADAFFLVEGLRRSDSYSYSHAISCSALAAAFGRHMGFDEETIFSLAAGGLLMDVGKTRLPETLLRYQGSLALSEVNIIRSHVEHGLAVLEESGIANLDV
ncbi:MAG: HD-GYP domain-containing protein, partial [Rhodanobacter sp.]